MRSSCSFALHSTSSLPLNPSLSLINKPLILSQEVRLDLAAAGRSAKALSKWRELVRRPLTTLLKLSYRLGREKRCRVGFASLCIVYSRGHEATRCSAALLSHCAPKCSSGSYSILWRTTHDGLLIVFIFDGQSDYI